MEQSNSYRPATLVTSKNVQIRFLQNFATAANADMIVVQKAVAGAGQDVGNMNMVDLAVVIGTILGVIKDAYLIVGDNVTTDFVINHGKGDDKVFAYAVENFGNKDRQSPLIRNIDVNKIEVLFTLPPLVGENYYVVVL